MRLEALEVEDGLADVTMRRKQEVLEFRVRCGGLAKLIERGVVSGWDNPRLATVQGISRRGLQLEALEQLVMDQAMSVANTHQEWDKIWAFNHELLDARVPRYFAVSDEGEAVPLTLTNVAPQPEGRTVPLVPGQCTLDSKAPLTVRAAYVDAAAETFSKEHLLF